MKSKLNELKTAYRSSGDHVTRRSFLGRLLSAGLAGLGFSSFVAGCGGGEQGPPTENQERSEPLAECEDISGLTDQEVLVRESLGYVAVSPNPNQTCSNCRFYTKPAGGEVCGGCQLFAGPVNAGGYCNSWAVMAA